MTIESCGWHPIKLIVLWMLFSFLNHIYIHIFYMYVNMIEHIASYLSWYCDTLMSIFEL